MTTVSQEVDIATAPSTGVPVSYSCSEGVAHIQLNRPDASNSVNLPLAEAFGHAVDLAADDDEVRAVLVTGAGERFCAGGDVASMVDAADGPAHVEQLALAFDSALLKLGTLDKPVVAGVRGAVAGAGLALMLTCDIVIAGGATRFLTAYAGVGLTPDCGLSWLLPRAVGQQRALELLMTQRVLGAPEAVEWGMVTEVVPNTAVAERAREVARRWATGPSFAHGQARGLVRASYESTRAAVGIEEARVIALAAAQPDSIRLLDGFARR